MHHIISPDSRSRLLSPPAPPITPPSIPPCLQRPLTYPLHTIGWSPPVTTTSDKHSLPASAPTSHRGPESVAPQYIARPYSASLGCRPQSPRSLPPALLSPVVDIPRSPPPVSLDVSLWPDTRPCVENFPGTVPCRGLAPTSLTRKSTPPVLRTWKNPGYSRVGSLPSQDTCKTCPTLLRIFQVSHYRQPLVLPRRQYSPQVFKRGDRLKRSSIGL